MSNKKCEYCNFGNYESFEETFPGKDTLYGMYGKAEDAKEDVLTDNGHSFDTLRLVKTNKGYFIEATASYEFDLDFCRNYTQISFCPFCGRRLTDD